MLCPLLLDAHNRRVCRRAAPAPAPDDVSAPLPPSTSPPRRYAGAEYVSGLEPRPALHQKGLIERRQCAYVADAVRGALERLLVDGDRAAALSYCEAACSRLLMGEVS